MHEVAAFLRGHPPFDLASDEELEDVASAVEIEFHPAGEVLIAAGAPPLDHAHVVRRGALELLDGERVLDVLGEGELAGHPSMLSGEPAGMTVRAAEDTLTYRVPAEVLAPLLARPGGLRWVARSLGRRVGAQDSERPTFEPTGRPVGQLARPPLLVTPATTVGEAARRMADEGASCALVDLGTGLGILTDRDFRERVLAAGRGPETVVGEVMTAPARAVAGDRSSEDVLLELLDLGVRHAPVVDADGRLLGVVSDLELLAGGPDGALRRPPRDRAGGRPRRASRRRRPRRRDHRRAARRTRRRRARGRRAGRPARRPDAAADRARRGRSRPRARALGLVRARLPRAPRGGAVVGLRQRPRVAGRRPRPRAAAPTSRRSPPA